MNPNVSNVKLSPLTPESDKNKSIKKQQPKSRNCLFVVTEIETCSK